MKINEAASLLQMRKSEVKIAIEQGVELPKSHKLVQLKAQKINDDYDIDEEILDSFIKKFHEEEPGGHPPIAVRRKLLVESRHCCAICRERTPIEFHHIIEYSTLKHYDVQHMLAVCPTDHSLCTKGDIDQEEQYMYKRKLNEQNNLEKEPEFLYSIGPANFSWDDLREIIIKLHSSVVVEESGDASKYDFTTIDINTKNVINRLGEEYYNSVVTRHEPYFNRISSFLSNPINSDIRELYYQIVDEIRSKIAINRDSYKRFELFLNVFTELSVRGMKDGRSQYRRTLNILMSFMYVNCDIGRKK